MYYKDGLIYRVLSRDVLMIIMGLIILSIFLFARTKKMRKGTLPSAIFVLVGGLLLTGIDTYTVFYPTVETCDGYFVKENRSTRSSTPLNQQYVFDPRDGRLKQQFYLDHTSKEKIYPDDFIVGEYYRITYEGRTNIILNVEKIDPP